jgi:murein L,D-transpeptidase YafK
MLNMARFFVFSFLILISCSTRGDKPIVARIGSSIKKIVYCESSVQQRWKNKNVPLSRLIDSLKISPERLHILIQKSKYELGVYYDSTLLKNYPVVFGGNPVDDKLMQGDNCTPEGIFKIRSKYNHAKWSRFIWLDYPNADSWRKHNKAKAKGLIPKDAGIGGEVGIHGIPQGYDFAIDLKQNWTLGCISLKNKDVIEIYPVMHKDIRIEIRK